MARPRDRMLDVIRGAAILLVLVFHLRVATGVLAIDLLIRPVIDVGWVGVDLFFVLSGLLIGGIVLDQIDSPGGFSRTRFFGRRALRLWPVLYLYLGTMLVIGGAEAWGMVLPVTLHVQNYAVDIPSHLWSLAVEEHFYLLLAFGLPWVWRRGGPQLLGAALIVPIVGCLLLRLAALDRGVLPVEVQWQTPYRIDALAAGVLLALTERYRPTVFLALQAKRGLCLAGAAIGFAWLATHTDLRLRYGLGLTVAWIAAALVIVALRGHRISHGAAPARLLMWLGAISYPAYVWHVSLGRLADAIAEPLIDVPLALTAWRYTMVLGGAAAITACVERPFMRLRWPEARRDLTQEISPATP